MSQKLPKFTQNFDLAYQNLKPKTENFSVRFRKPEFFKKNLDKKLIRIQKFTLNNKGVPCFIPNRLTSLTNGPYYSSSAGGIGILPQMGAVFGINSLEYFIIIRSVNTSHVSSASQQSFLQLIPENPNTVPPIAPIDDDVTYYLTPYYYYFNFTDFLSLVEININNAYGAMLGSSVYKQYASFVLSNDGITLYIDTGVQSQFIIEFSQSLIDILPFKSLLSPYTVGAKSYMIEFPVFQFPSAGVNYNIASCPLYESIFPFSELLINSDDMGVNYTIFLNNDTLASNVQQGEYNHTILAFSIRTNQITQIYDYYTYVNNEDSLFNNFVSDTNDEDYITVTLYLRLKNSILIPYPFMPKELFTMTLELSYIQ
jgi:hypothetical protein